MALSANSVIWRIQSLVHAVEARDHILSSVVKRLVINYFCILLKQCTQSLLSFLLPNSSFYYHGCKFYHNTYFHIQQYINAFYKSFENTTKTAYQSPTFIYQRETAVCVPVFIRLRSYSIGLRQVSRLLHHRQQSFTSHREGHV